MKIPHSTDDRDLFLLMKQDAYDAFTELYNRYWRKLYRIASKKTDSAEDAMDLVHDLFVELWNKRDRIVITTSADSYMVSCLYYKTFAYFRTKGLREEHLRNFKDFISSDALSDTTALASHEREAEYELLQEIINRAIEHLPERMRAVFQMTRSGDMPVAEVAKALDLSPQTVKNQASRALQRLREELGGHAIELPVGLIFFLLINK